jgi:hypothetical protein
MMMIVALILAAVLSTPFVGAVQLPAPSFAMNLQESDRFAMNVVANSQAYRLVQTGLHHQAVKWGGSFGWLSTDYEDPLGHYFLIQGADKECKIYDLIEPLKELHRPMLAVTNLTAGNFTSGKSSGFAYFHMEAEGMFIGKLLGYTNVQKVVYTDEGKTSGSVTNSNGGKFVAEFSDLTGDLTEAERKLASQDHPCFHPKLCPGGKEGEIMTFYNAMLPSPGRFMANQNAASARGEIFYLYFVASSVRMDFQVTRYEHVIVDSRWNAYERCNPILLDPEAPFMCERSSFLSPRGVGFVEVGWNATFFPCETEGTGINWYSFNERGNGLTYDFSQSVNSTIEIACVIKGLNAVLPWNGTNRNPPRELYPALESAFLNAFDTCEHVQ